MENMQAFIKQIKNNLEANGFPAKKVSFDVEKMYELADNKGLSFNTVLDELKKENIDSEISTEKVLFSPIQAHNSDQDMFAQAQEMLSKMTPEEIENIKKMYENMSDSDKEDMLKQAKSMGMV